MTSMSLEASILDILAEVIQSADESNKESIYIQNVMVISSNIPDVFDKISFDYDNALKVLKWKNIDRKFKVAYSWAAAKYFKLKYPDNMIY